MQCLVYRIDEDDSQGTLFDSVREAVDHLKQRAFDEDKSWSEYVIKPVENAI